MKYSQFNIFFDLNPKYSVLYNSLSDKYIVLGKGLKDEILNLSLIEIYKKYKWLYIKLLNAGAIIEDHINEINVVSNMINKIDNDLSSYQLIVNPTLNCNFRCWYCYEKHQKKSMMSDQTLFKIEKFILNIILKQKQIKQFNLAFFGGEPLLGYKKIVKPLIQYCYEQCKNQDIDYRVNFTTNGYLINDEMILFFRTHNVESLQITLDGYKDIHDKVRNVAENIGSYNKIVKNIKKLISNNIQVILRINYTAQTVRSIENILSEFEDLAPEIKDKLHVNFQRIWQDDKTYDVDEEIDKCLHKCFKTNLKASKAAFSSINSSCYADKRNELLINYNGDVYKCTARDFTQTNRMGVLRDDGEIEWNNNSLEKWMTIKFSRDICHHCSIAPLCAGGCRQKAIETKNIEGCLMNYNEEQKIEIIKDQFYTQFILNCD